MNRRLGRFCLAVGWMVGSMGCGESDLSTQEPVFVSRDLARGDGLEQFDHALGFEDGTTLDRITVRPVPLVAGEPFEVRFAVEPAVGAQVRVGVRPPRDGGRQVAQGGVDAPAQALPPDRRARFVDVVASDGIAVATLSLPRPWHPRAAMLTAEVVRDGRRMAGRSGPRTHDGTGVVALVSVESVPTQVMAARSRGGVNIDGRLNDAVWNSSSPVGLVQSTEGEPVATAQSSVRFAWDDDALYVGAHLEDSDIWSDYRQPDDPLWKQEVFEVFVFGDTTRGNYLELQVSPRGVRFDARFVEYRKGDVGWQSRWKTAVDVAGTIDDRTDLDQSWTVEVAIPWSEICAHTEVDCPPQAGGTFRLNVFRFDRPARQPPVALALSPTRVPDFHAPENAAVMELRP